MKEKLIASAELARARFSEQAAETKKEKHYWRQIIYAIYDKHFLT